MNKRSLPLLLCSLAWTSCAPPVDESEKRPSVATLYELDLHEPLNERGLALLGPGKPSFYDALSKVRALVDEPLAKGLFVRLGPLHGRFGDLADWAATFDALRAKKRPVHCHFDSADNLSTALASHCDRVSMTPSGTLELVGLSAQLLHGKELLDSVGVQADLMQVGKYKGAAEPFTRDTPSEPLLESLNGLLNDLDGTLQSHLGKAGARSKEQVRALIDGGPYTAEQAKAQGLVEALSYDDEARALAKKAVSAAAVRAVFPERKDEGLSLKDLLDALGKGNEDERSDEPRLAVAYLVGEIVDGEQGGMERAASEPFVKALRRFADDSRVRAVVLRIESPGGSALASDRMWHAVRRVVARKPVIVSVGDMAASGGYYVASAGSQIVASEGSIVGSIGVVGGKMVLSELAKKVGVHVSSLPRAQHAAWLSPLSPFNPSERQRLEQMLSHTYDLFLNRISIGRKLPVERILPGAEGRVMGGERAKQLGLIDEVGGLGRALELAYERGKLAKSAKVVTWPEAAGPLQALTSMFGAHSLVGGSATADLLTSAPEEAAASVAKGALVRVLAHGRTQVATTLPFELMVR